VLNWLALYLVAAVTVARGFSLVVSSRPGSANPESRVLSASGLPLPAETRCQALALSGELTPGCGATAAAALFVPFGNPVSLTQPGTIEREIRRTLNAANDQGLNGQAIRLLFYNGAMPSQASEWLLVEFPAAWFARDSALGLETQRSLHLANAVPLIGSRDAQGQLRAALTPGPTFAEWIQAALPSAMPAARAAGEDPDGDGVSNFMEFAQGRNPSLREAPSTLLLRHSPRPGYFLLGWQAADPPNAELFPEASDGLAPWAPVSGARTPATAPLGVTLLPGAIWMELEIAAGTTTRGLFRLKAFCP
jgi:hypothetical protein